MAKAETFNINDKKTDQRKTELLMSPSERLILCLDLMDLHNALRPQQEAQPPADNIQWIELYLKKK